MTSKELLQVQVYFRHGCRTPLHHVQSPLVTEALWDPKQIEDLPHTVYPYDLVDLCTTERIDYDPSKSYPTFKLPGGAMTGQLLNIGQQETFDLGRRLKQTYVDQYGFISRTFRPNETFFRTTYLLRTIKSLRCVIAGLFGESYKENGTTEKARLHVLPLEKEYLFPNPKAHGLKGKLFSEGMEECSQCERHKQMKMRLRKELGVDILTDDMDPRSLDKDCPIWFVRDDYIARQRAGYPLPGNLEVLMPEVSEMSVEELLWELLGRKAEWPQNVSTVINKVYPLILSNMQNHNGLPKFQLYSCHDSMIALMLYGLGLFDHKWPPFAADIIFELYRWPNGPSNPNFKWKTPRFSLQGQGLSMTMAAVPETQNLNPMPNGWSADDMRDLWFRILYLGQPLPLVCLWNLQSPANFDMAEHLYPVSLLVDVLVDHLKRTMAQQPNGSV